MLIPTRTLLGCLSARFSAAICYSGGAPRLLHEDKILSCVPVYFKRNSLPPCSLSRESVAVSTRWRNFNCRYYQKPQSSLVVLCTFAVLLLRGLAEHPSSAAALWAVRQLLQHIRLLQAGTCNRLGLDSTLHGVPRSRHTESTKDGCRNARKGKAPLKRLTAIGVTAAAPQWLSTAEGARAGSATREALLAGGERDLNLHASTPPAIGSDPSKLSPTPNVKHYSKIRQA